MHHHRGFSGWSPFVGFCSVCVVVTIVLGRYLIETGSSGLDSPSTGSEHSTGTVEPSSESNASTDRQLASARGKTNAANFLTDPTVPVERSDLRSVPSASPLADTAREEPVEPDDKPLQHDAPRVVTKPVVEEHRPPESRSAVAFGRELFLHQWRPHDPLAGGGDGLGPVFNGRSCAECHFQGGRGGSGTNEHNVLAFEILPTAMGDPVLTGVVHASAIQPDQKETATHLRELYPAKVKAGQVSLDGARVVWMNTPSLWGSGLIDELSDSVLTQSLVRDQNDSTRKGQVGRLRILPNGSCGKFGWKSQSSTLHEFVAGACASELGLSNSFASQHQPRRFQSDSSARDDMTADQIAAMVKFVGSLPAPRQVLPDDPAQRARIAHGGKLFSSTGCANCHIPDVGSVQGVYSDFRLHLVVDRVEIFGDVYYSGKLDVPVPPEYPYLTEWKTPPLWGVADTAPYWHDGSAKTLQAAILRHADEALTARENYKALPSEDQESLVAFLGSLRAPR